MNAVRKAAHLVRFYRDRKRGSETIGAPPLRLWVESTNRCNLRCTMCPNKDTAPGDKGHMSLELFRKIVDEARDFVGDLYLHHRGEPLLNPALFDMIRYARAAGLRVRFHSNGCLLTEERARALLAAGPDLVSFSIDGFEKSLYEQVRVGGTFETTLANVLRFVELRRAQGLRKPYVVVEKIVFRDQAEPPEAARATARETWQRFLAAGVDEVIEKEEYAWAEEGAAAPPLPPVYSACTFLWYAMVICWNGIVTPCPQDYHAAMRLGDVNTASLREIWNGPAYRELRRRMLRDASSLPLCSGCDRLRRKTVGGLPLQYMATFLVDHFVGYGRLRKLIGTAERNG